MDKIISFSVCRNHFLNKNHFGLWECSSSSSLFYPSSPFLQSNLIQPNMSALFVNEKLWNISGKYALICVLPAVCFRFFQLCFNFHCSRYAERIRILLDGIFRFSSQIHMLSRLTATQLDSFPGLPYFRHNEPIIEHFLLSPTVCITFETE